MKKIILTVAAVFVLSFANAQQREKGTIELAPQIGFSSSNYSGGDAGPGNNPVTGLAFGVTGDYFFNDRWSIRSGVLFQKMGTEFNGFEDNLSYITFPLNANWHFGSTRKWYLNFGPSIGLLTAAKGDGEDLKDFFNTTQFGLNVGIGYKIEVSPKISILIDYQGMAGLTDIIKGSEFSTMNSFGSFNTGVVLKL
jgi:opacity protein-like surface antigen